MDHTKNATALSLSTNRENETFMPAVIYTLIEREREIERLYGKLEMRNLAPEIIQKQKGGDWFDESAGDGFICRRIVAANYLCSK